MITKVFYAGATGAYTDSSTKGLRIESFNFPRPTVKTYTVDVPGRNGLVDLSEVLTGGPTYNNITGTVRFIVLKSANFDLDDFINTYHGQIMRLYTDEKPTYYYIGRATVTAEELKLGRLRTFTLTVNAEPFLWANSLTTKSITRPAADASGLTFSTSSNLASGYPQVSGGTITLRNNDTTQIASASYTVPTTSGKWYFFHFAMAGSSNAADHVQIRHGSTAYYIRNLTQGVAFKARSSSITITFYERPTTSQMNATFSGITFGEMVSVADTSMNGATELEINTAASCTVYTTGYSQALTSGYKPISLNLRDDYIGLGGASTSGTATLRYRKGVLA